ncbi:MAG: right-handed parallel beta-helix repeat-containing protein [Bacteroidales bacterium]|nr:right-handed parallel beta-helix repeat-containing protein [Bacteroidales bacterium]
MLISACGSNIDEIRVADFGAVPGDGQDDSKPIQAAIDSAMARGVKLVTFEAGTYEFKGLPGWGTDQRGNRTCYVTIEESSGLELAGALDEHGNPATLWLKDNDLKEGQPMILSVQGGSSFTLRNIAVDMAPYYYSAGKVLDVAGSEVRIEVLPGHPVIDNQKPYIMGTYDLEARKTKIVRLTWDFDLPQWKVIGSEADRRMVINHEPLAQSCQVGDGVFWFQGNYTGALIALSGIDGLLLENVRILNGHGFPITNNRCRDITYRNVSIKPEGNRIATVCRDGFKIYSASGKVLMDGIHIEGCLGDDAQNIHGTWLAGAEKISGNIIQVPYQRGSLTTGEKLILLDDEFRPAWQSTIVDCISENGNMKITFADTVPDWVHDKTPVEPQEWLPDSLHITNSVYRSSGRFGILLKSSNTLIENSLFENNVAGIQIGGEWSWGYWLESTNSQHVEIRNCTFRDNRLDIRFGGQPMETAINIASWTDPERLGVPSETHYGLIRDVRIHDNLFENEKICVSLQNCADVWFWNNKMINCGTDLVIHEKTTGNINRTPFKGN